MSRPTQKVDPSELVAAIDIASLLGVVPSAVSNWDKRHPDFPKPVVRVANGRTALWLRAEILRWHAMRDAASRGDLHARIERTEATLKALKEVASNDASNLAPVSRS